MPFLPQRDSGACGKRPSCSWRIQPFLQGSPLSSPRAASALSEGGGTEARALVLEARGALVPAGAEASTRSSTPSASPLEGGYLQRIRDGGRGMTAFVFATLRYASGNWDSAPLVPSNLIHSWPSTPTFR